MSENETPSNVRFSGSVRLDESIIREVAVRLYRPFSILSNVSSVVSVGFGLYLVLAYGESGLPYLIGCCIAAAIIQAERIFAIRRNVRLMTEHEHEMARQLPDVFVPDRECLFTDEGIFSARTGKVTPYSSVRKVLETPRLLLLLLPGGMYVAVEKDTLQGGTVEEFKQFIDEKRKAAN